MTTVKRSDYTQEERLKILQYIIENKKYCSLRGNAMWIQMEEDAILPRTWQSMKQHFRTKIIRTIHSFNIPKDEKTQIIEGYNSTSLKRKNKYDDERVNVPRKDFRNKFSDETDDDIESTPIVQQRNDRQNETQIISPPSTPPSPNLIAENIHESNLQCTEINLDESSSSKICNKISNEKDIVPTERRSIILSSDSDSDVTIVAVNNIRAPEIEIVSKIDEFSLEEDTQLLDFMKKDPKFLKNRNKSFVYQFYVEINQSTRPWEILKDRFNNHILPNLERYGLNLQEIRQIYEDAEIPIPLKIEEPIKTNDVQKSPVKKNAETQNCEHEIAKDTEHYIHTMLKVHNELHIFVTDADEKIDISILLNRLASKYSVDRENIHYVDLNDFHYLEGINKQKNSIQKQFIVALAKSLINKSKETNQDKIMDILKSLQDFTNQILEEESSEEEMEIANSQNFDPQNNSTPEKKVNDSEQEVESICISTDCSKTSEEILIQPQIKTNITSSSILDPEIIVDNEIDEESLSSLKSNSIPNITNIFGTDTSLDFPSSESFHTAPSQNVDD